MRTLRASSRLPTIRSRRWRYSMRRRSGCRPRRKWRSCGKFRRRSGGRSRVSTPLPPASATDSSLPLASHSPANKPTQPTTMKRQAAISTKLTTPTTTAAKISTSTPIKPHHPLSPISPSFPNPPHYNNRSTEATCGRTWTSTSSAGAKK